MEIISAPLFFFQKLNAIMVLGKPFFTLKIGCLTLAPQRHVTEKEGHGTIIRHCLHCLHVQ